MTERWRKGMGRVGGERLRGGRVGEVAELLRLFFRRFWANDLLGVEGDALQTLARALAVVTMPGLLLSFFLQNAYPQRPAWGRIEDQYFFVLFSFAVMGAVAVFEWEMLFPERLDFLVLTPLGLRGWQMLLAKAGALVAFLGLFLVGANVCGVVMLPMVSKGVFWRMVAAQTVAVGMAGVFAAMGVLAVGAVLLCVLPEGVFRRVSPVAQGVAVVGLGLLVLHYLRFGDALETLLAGHTQAARFVPTFWFLGVYQVLLHGAEAQAFAAPMARTGVAATAVAAAVVVAVYPLAWVRQQRMAMEGTASRQRAPRRWRAKVREMMVRRPAERAVFAFIGQTVTRNGRYQVFLAMYWGVGLALSISCGTTLGARGDGVVAGISRFGLRAVMPLLLFWTVAGLRMTFGLPLHLPARWVFRVTAADLATCARATRVWAMGCGMGVVVVVGVVLAGLELGWREVAVQVVCGGSLCALLVEGFFYGQDGPPFSRPPRSERSNLPAMLTLYLGVLPPFLFGMVFLAMFLERRLWWLGAPVVLAAGARPVLEALRRRTVYLAEEGETAEGEFQLLGLSAQ